MQTSTFPARPELATSEPAPPGSMDYGAPGSKAVVE